MSESKAAEFKKSTLLQLYARATAPSRDYYGLTIAESCICLNIWKITHGPHSFPKQKFCEIKYFHDDKYLQEEIKSTFGENVFDYIRNLSGKKRRLENIPQQSFLQIIRYLGINDILKLARTNKIFYELCHKEEVWQIIFRKILHRVPSAEEKRMSFDCGWKETLKRRMFYIKQAVGVAKKKSVSSAQQKTVSSTKQVTSVKPKKSVTNKTIVSKKCLIKAK